MTPLAVVLFVGIAWLHAESVHDHPRVVQQPPNKHAQHHDEVNKRGNQAMGFSHAKTTHHFRLKENGGVIEVSANDPKDGASRDQIRHHLTRIAELFGKGDFSLPMFTHGEPPPGTAEMTRLREDIKYTFEAMDRGGRVVIVSDSAEAIAAIHRFLRFQIEDHQTGDSIEVEKQ